MRAQLYAAVFALLTIAGLGWLLWQSVEETGQLQQQVIATEQALQQTAESMQQLDQMYRAADQQLAINRRQHQQINTQLRGEVDALRKALDNAVCAAADLPNIAADRLRIITDSNGAGDTAAGAVIAD